MDKENTIVKVFREETKKASTLGENLLEKARKKTEDFLQHKKSTQKTAEEDLCLLQGSHGLENYFREIEIVGEAAKLESPFSFPPTQKYAEKIDKVLSISILGSNISYYMHKFDKKISNFLSNLGTTEYIITTNNILSKTARKLMKIKLPGEADEQLIECPEGQRRTKWAYMVNKMENPQKYKDCL